MKIAKLRVEKMRTEHQKLKAIEEQKEEQKEKEAVKAKALEDTQSELAEMALVVAEL